MDHIRLSQNPTVLDQSAKILTCDTRLLKISIYIAIQEQHTRVGVVDLVDFVRVQPYLPFTTLKYTGRQAFLQLKGDHLTITMSS